VSGSGWMKFTIPNQAKLPGLDGAANRDLNVHWDESMNFNGLNAEFVGRVEAKLGLAIMHCEQMKVQLLERISFQSTTLESNPALKIIYCRENVRFENSTYFEKKLIDKYRGRVGEFEWNHSTGDVIAQGPGEVQLWRRQQKGSSGFAPKDTIQANRPIPVEIAEWDYTRIQFEGKLAGHVEGDLNGSSERQTATIDDRVEVIHGPVRLPNEKVDQDDLPSRAGTMRCDKLEFRNYPKTDRNPVEYRQLIGIGNAEVEGQVDGRRFTASADDISFDGSKGLYILLAHGKRNARLTEIGSSNIAGRRIEFNPQLKSLRGDQMIEGQGSQSQ
jgi:predicted Rdx family selenoprotein